MKNRKSFLISATALLAVALPLVSFAALVPCGSVDKPCTLNCFFVMINNILKFITFDIATPLAAAAIMVSGIMLSFGGSEKAIARGREILKATLIGLFFVFAAWLIVDLVLRGLLGGSFLPWNQFPATCP
jgi:type IV secretory pathway VirB2 component (pilin)